MVNEMSFPGEPDVSPPMVYIRQHPKWEYLCISHPIVDEEPPDTTTLNALGAEGWELVGLFRHENELLLYFKRVRME